MPSPGFPSSSSSSRLWRLSSSLSVASSLRASAITVAGCELGGAVVTVGGGGVAARDEATGRVMWEEGGSGGGGADNIWVGDTVIITITRGLTEGSTAACILLDT